MGFAPIKWTCTAFFRPRQLTDRAILANRQPQEKKIGPLFVWLFLFRLTVLRHSGLFCVWFVLFASLC